MTADPDHARDTRGQDTLDRLNALFFDTYQKLKPREPIAILGTLITLRDGEIAVYRTQGTQPEKIAVTGGFAEVSERGLTVLAESVDA